MDVLVDIEASIDYPEYDVEEVTSRKILNVINEIENEIESLEKTFENGKIIKERFKYCNYRKAKCWKIFSFECNIKYRKSNSYRI